MRQNISTKNERKKWLLLLALALSACANHNPFNIGDSAFSEIENRLVKTGKARTSLLFFMVDGKLLEEGFFKARVDMEFKIPPGNRWMAVETIYAPKGYWALGGGPKNYYAAAILEIEAKTGQRYHVSAKIKNIKSVQIWIENRQGDIVSEIVTKDLIPLTSGTLRFYYLQDLLNERNRNKKVLAD